MSALGAEFGGDSLGSTLGTVPGHGAFRLLAAAFAAELCGDALVAAVGAVPGGG